MMLGFSLPLPPSANNAYANRKRKPKKGKGYGRVKTKRYRDWVKQADAYYTFQSLQRAPHIGGPRYACKMIFPRMRGDIDGRDKLILDWMVSRRLTPDDRYCRKLELEMDEENHGDLVWIAAWDLPQQLPANTAVLSSA